MITGYGRGWQEPKAHGLWARLWQRMREPATWPDYIAMYAALSVWTIVCALFFW